MLLIALAACEPTDVKLAPQNAEELAELCEGTDQKSVEQTITFPQWREGCAWGEDGNNEREDAHFSARREEIEALELPEGTAACGLGLDFGAPGGGESTPMIYDDNFVFTLDGIVLATSYAPLLDVLPVGDGYAIWDWEAVVGTELSFDTSIPSWCLGEAEGESSCEIPLPEQEGSMSLSFGEGIVDDLSYVTYSTGKYDFAFITLGDNDDTDCSHEAFSFSVELPYIEL